jgi:hypothetical protein
MGATPGRLARIRQQIEAGTYAPDADDVTEAVLAWVVPGDVFDRPREPDRFKSPEATVEGPLDRSARRSETARDVNPRR